MSSSNTKAAGGAVWTGTFGAAAGQGLSAAGTTQAGATPISADISEFTTVAASAGARLPVADMAAGDDLLVANFGANALALYPPVGHKANNGATNAAVSIPVGKVAHAYFMGNSKWLVVISA